MPTEEKEMQLKREDLTPPSTSAESSDATRFSNLVGAIYDAALTPSRWPSVLDDCRAFIGGMSAAFFARDITAASIGDRADALIDPADSELFADDVTRRRLELIMPHVRRAMLIGTTMQRSRVEAASFSDALDGFAAGVFLVDAAGRVVHTNAAALELLQAGVLTAHNNRLALSDRRSSTELTRLIAAAGEGRAPEVESVAFNSNDDEPYVAHLQPLAVGKRRLGGVAYQAVAAIFVRPATLPLPAAPEIIARTFGLTPSELRVMLSIVEVGSVPEAAEALGIGESTVKTHLHRLFGKTDTTRQSDLVKLVAGFASPLVQRA
jgi:DNA-binding CsgD family transcriptional regulator